MFDFQILQQWANEKPNEIAFVDDSQSITYFQLNSLVLRAATFLQQRGIKKEMIVNVHLPSLLNWILTLALHILGVTSTSRKSVGKSNPILIPDFHISLRSEPSVSEDRNIIFNEELFESLKKCDDFVGPFGFDSPNDVARLIPTSGTTGDVKFVPVLAKDIEPLAKLSSSWDVIGDGKSLGLFPLGAKQSYRFALSILLKGQTLYRIDSLDYKAAKVLRRNPIHSVFGSPHHLLQLLDVIEHTGSSLPELKYVAISGNSPSEKLINRLKSEFNCTIFNVYGSTEVGNAGVEEIDPKKPKGFKVNDQVELQIVDESGQPQPPNEIGIVRYRSSTMADGYYKNPKTTAEFFKEGFFYPGDLGMLDENNRLHLDGRTQEVINLNGVKYNPEYLEQIVQAQLGVIDCAAFSLESIDGSQKLAFAMVTDDDFDLNEFSKVASKKLPVRIDDLFKVEFIPRNENGKTERTFLAQTYGRES